MHLYCWCKTLVKLWYHDGCTKYMIKNLNSLTEVVITQGLTAFRKQISLSVIWLEKDQKQNYFMPQA